MSETPTSDHRLRRHPWPRALVRIRRTWFGLVETVSFFAAVAGALGRFLIGRWPAPLDRDYLAPKDPAHPPKRRLTSRKATTQPAGSVARVSQGGSK